MRKVRTMLVDDHAVVRRGLKSILDSSTDIEVCAEAGDLESALESARTSAPDVVVLDLQLGGGQNGLDLVEPLRQICPDVAIIILTAFLNLSLLRRSIELGVSGYLVKDSNDLDLASTILSAADGKKIFDPDVLDLERRTSGSSWNDITPREEQVLALVCKGYSNAEIANETSSGEGAVKAVVSNLMRKMGCRNRVELVIKAREERLY